MKKQFPFFILIITSFFSYSQFTPLITGTIVGNKSFCAYTESTYSIAPVTGATSYNWSFPFSWIGKSSTNTISIIPNLNSGTISVTTTNNNGQIISARLPLNLIDCNTQIFKYGLSGFDGLINVSPNPNYGKLSIDYNIDKTLLVASLINLQEIEIYKGNLYPDNKKEIDLHGITGFFILKISAPNNYLLFQKKIILE